MKPNPFIALSLVLFAALVLGGSRAQAQSSDLAALLEILQGTVEVNRVNTSQWIAVRVEAIVGVGDRIRTDATGSARITFFADGVESDLLPNTETRIESFNGSDQSFNLNLEVIVGQTVQRIGRALDASSSYTVTTPAMSLAARGTIFEVRVEDDGRSAMLVRESIVEATQNGENAPVSDGFGVRAEDEAGLSDVVRASTFDELDAALDGCTAALTTPDDVSLNVRLAPRTDAPRVGTVAASEIDTLFGATEASGWYRIAFRGGFGWVLSSTATIEEPCAGLRLFADDFAGEDAALYQELGEVIDLDALLTPTPAPGS